MLKHFLSRQFGAFLVVGVTAALLHWFSRILLSQFMPFPWAVAFAYVLAMMFAFLLNSYYVFPASDKPVRKQARDFFIINMTFFPIVLIVSLALNRTLIQFGVSWHSEEFAHALAISLPLPATFLLYKLLAFREKYYG